MVEIVLLDLISLVDRCFRVDCPTGMSGFGGSSAQPSRSALAIPDSGIQIVKDTTLTRLETTKRFSSLSVSGKSRLFWTQEGSRAGRKRNFHESLATRTQDAHCQPLLFSFSDGSHTHTHTPHATRGPSESKGRKTSQSEAWHAPQEEACAGMSDGG